MHAPAQLDFEFDELCLHTLAHRLAQYREPALSGLPAAVREAEEIEGPWLVSPTVAPSPISLAAEGQQACLVGVQLQAKLLKPLAQFREEALRLLPMLEPDDEVIGVAHDHDLSVRLLLPPSLGPQIEYVVQEDTGQERTDVAALDRAFLTAYSLSLFQHAGPEPFLDQAHDAPVPDAVLDELHQPPVIEGVKERTDIGIEHPVHLTGMDTDGQRIQCLMRIAPWPEAIRETEEVLFVDRIEHLDDSALDELVFQCRHAKWSLAPVCLRDVRSTHRSCSVRPTPQPVGEVSEVGLQLFAVLLPGLSIDTGGGRSLQGEVGVPQAFDIVDVVQERGEPLPPISPGGLTYPVELLLALGRWEPLRDLLLRIFANQNPDGDWPQWFMFFERERNIRP